MLPAKVVSASLIDGSAASVRQTAEGLEVDVPVTQRNEIDTIVVLAIDKEAHRINPITSVASLNSGARAIASNVYQNNPSYSPAMTIDGDEKTRWATDAGTRKAWLQLDLKRSQDIGGVRIVQEKAYADRITRFQIEYRSSGSGPWLTAAVGSSLNKPDSKIHFATVNVRQVRLNILDTIPFGGPTISEFELLAPTDK